MRKKLVSLAAMLTASAFATSAQAAVDITGPSGTFGDSNVVCEPTGLTGPCAFTLNFDFVTPENFNSAFISVQNIANLANPLTDIDFTTVTFNGVNFDIFSSAEPQEVRNISASLVAGFNNRISVSGITGGNAALNGNISFASMAAVPEPTTWMLMLMGMAGIGFSMRRKEKQTLRERYT